MKEGKLSYASNEDAIPRKTGIPKEWIDKALNIEMIDPCINEHPTIIQNTISREELDRFCVREHFGSQGTSAHPRYYAPGLFNNLKRNCQCFFDETAKKDSQPKNPPRKKLSKKQFYKLLERCPSPLITNPLDERVTMNHTELIWFSQCKKPIPLKEVMALRKKYYPDLFKKPSVLDNLPAQGGTSYMHPERTPYYLRGEQKQ